MTFSIAESHRFLLSYCLFQPLQIIRIRVRKSLVEILDHCVQIGQMNTTIPTLDGGEGYASNGGCGLYITANCGNVDVNPPYQLMVIHSSKLVYPRELYQRGVERKRVELIAANFNEYVRSCAIKLRDTTDQFIWESPKTGLPCNPTHFRDVFRKSLEEAGDVRLLTPHSCRHTYVSQMQALGVDIQTIQSIVGHADTEMTEHYLHVQESIRQSAIQLFSEAFSA